MNLIKKSKLLATVAHAAIRQKRKYTRADYIVHPEEVVNTLIAAGIKDPVTISAAWLHDVVEDTGITSDFVSKHIHKDVAYVLDMVTDISKPEDGNRKTRKSIDRKHYLTSDHRGKSIKLADCLSNGSDLRKNDPNFSRVYFEEITLLLPYLEGGNSLLFFLVKNMIKRYNNDIENERLQKSLNKK